MRVGLAIASDAVRLVCVRDGRVLWAGEAPVLADLPLEAAVGRLLESAGLPRWPRPVTVAAVGPARAQLKRLAGLPPVRDARALSRLVAENAARFFLRNGVPLATAAAMTAVPGEGWGCAIDTAVVREVADVCRRHRLRLVGLTPSVAVLGAGLTSERVVWQDGDVAAEVVQPEGRLEDVRRVPTGEEHGAPAPEITTALAGLGDDAWRFADAYGAAMAPRALPLMVRASGQPAIERDPVPQWRLMLAACTLAIAAGVLAFAPLAAAANASRSAQNEILALAPTRGTAARAESDLRRVTAALNEAAAFDRRRRSPLAVLAELTERLPESAQLVSIRLDSAGGTIVALAAQSVAVVAALEGMPSVVAPAIVGPVTREAVAGQEKERVTVRFQWTPALGASR